MNKEKITRTIIVKIQPSLFLKFESLCKNEYKTLSEKIRELITVATKEKQ